MDEDNNGNEIYRIKIKKEEFNKQDFNQWMKDKKNK